MEDLAPPIVPRGHAAFKTLLRERKGRLADLVALSPKRDPFCAGAPGQHAKAEWFLGLWQQFAYTGRVHLRRIHYRLVSQPDPRKADGTPYLNTEACWQALQEASTYARYLGLVDPRSLEDHRNPEPRMPFSWYAVVTDPALGWGEAPLAWTLPTIATDLAADLSLPFPEPQLTGYDYSLPQQAYHLEVWIEKSTMNDVLLPLVQRYGAVLVTSVGFQSITSAIQLIVQRVQRDGKPTRLFYLSDFDPAGDRMPVALARQIEFWLEQYAPGADVKLTPLVLTREQVAQFQLPRVPIKETDLRKGAFEDRHGEGAVELDALEALFPGQLARLVRAALDPYLDDTLEDQYAETAADAQAAADAQWHDESQPWRAQLTQIQEDAQAIYGRYQQELVDLAGRLEQELEPLLEQLGALEETVRAGMEAFAPAFPDRPAAAAVPEDETPWLYDSARTYDDQLSAYKTHDTGTRPEDV